MRQFHVDFGGNPALDGLGEVVHKLVSTALPTGAGRQPRLHAQNGVHQTMGLLHLNTQTHRQDMVSVCSLINRSIAGFCRLKEAFSDILKDKLTIKHDTDLGVSRNTE